MNAIPAHEVGGSPRSRLYEAAELQPLISPRSIAVIGASASGQGFGSRALAELLDARIDRPLYVVHPRFGIEQAPDGAIGVASVADLPEPVDCVLIALPAAAVVGVVEQCAAQGCKAALIFSSGFGEVEGGAAAEALLKDIAQRAGIRIGGPNTAGILNYRERLPLTFVSDLRMDIAPGNLAIVSQSAGLATHLGHRRNRGLGISYTIATGNSVDVTALDYVNVMLEDPHTDAVMLALEGLDMPNGLELLGRKARATGKAVIVLKTGRTQTGGKAAVSHTGSLAGNHEVFEAAAAAAGIPLVRTVEEMVEIAQLFSRWAKKPWRPGGTGILTTMGGPGVMAADAADDFHVNLPTPSDRTVAQLRKLVPAFAAVGNPIDTSASPKDDVLRECLEVVAADERYNSAVILAATMTGPSTAQRPAAIVAAVRNARTPIAAVWLSSWFDGPSSEVLDAEQELPVFRSSARCLQAIALWNRWHERRAMAEDLGEPLTADIAALRTAIARARQAEVLSGALSEDQSRHLIATLGAHMPRAVVANSVAEAVAAAETFGLPVVAKIVSPDIPHKAVVGGVKLDLRTTEAVRAAYDAILRDVAMARRDADLQGVLIAEMIAPGLEFMCGMVRDPVFGPVIVCGAGGAAVEELRDIGRCVGRITPDKAMAALEQVRAFQRLRAHDPLRAEQLADGLVALMQRLGDAAAREPALAEVDINPLTLRADGTLVALDALVVLA